MAALSPRSHKAPEQESLAMSAVPAGAASGPFCSESSCPDTFPQKGPARGSKIHFSKFPYSEPFSQDKKTPKSLQIRPDLDEQTLSHKEGF